MLSKPFVPLVPTLLSVALLGSPATSLSFPFFGKDACKDEKTRLRHEEQILRDRHQLALHQCHATLDSAHDRCQSLKRRQKGELNTFRDRRDGQLEECKRRAKGGPNDLKDDKKAAKATKDKNAKPKAKEAKTKTTKQAKKQ
jgi:hypothetical protein